jgi:hypothetical protein
VLADLLSVDELVRGIVVAEEEINLDLVFICAGILDNLVFFESSDAG